VDPVQDHAHFHVAGFAAALLAGLAAAAAPGRAAAVGCLGVPAGAAIVAVGHFTGRWTERVGAVVLTVGLLATSWVAGARVVLADRTAAVNVVGVALCGLWAWQRADAVRL